jgi:hypothetical protein
MRLARALQPTVENPDTVIVAANVAYGEYLDFGAYVCQPDRTFRHGPRWMGFYAQEAIQREIPEILFSRDRVPFTEAEVSRLESTGESVSVALAKLIRSLVKSSSRSWNEDFKVILLSPPDDPRTHQLPGPIMNNLLDHSGRGTAFTQYHRYTRLDYLERGPRFTDELVRMGHVTDDQKGMNGG